MAGSMLVLRFYRAGATPAVVTDSAGNAAS
jgi:hypothetical protein